jgi:hypothetical protein
MSLRETIGRVFALLGLCGGRHLRLRWAQLLALACLLA